MAATYRATQSSFQWGEIDPMVEANLNLSYRTQGLKESYNTLHLPNATVSKRPGIIREIGASFGDIESHYAWTPVEVQMESGETCILFLGSSARVILSGVFYDVPIYASEQDGETETISLAPALRHTAVYQQYIFVSYPEDTKTGFLVLKVEKDESEGVRVYSPKADIDASLYFPEDIGPCTRPLYVSNGRLLIGSGNVFNASRQRTEKQKETESGFPSWTVDFTLADYTYNYTYTYSATTSDGYEVQETVVYQAFDEAPPDDPFSEPEGIQQVIRNIRKETSDTDWEEYIVTETYAYGKVHITDIVKRTCTAGEVEANTSETFPDKRAYPGTPEVEKQEIPDVQPTHAIQVRENDMFGSSIRWITMAGRIIVGTDTAIHIGVDQYLNPQTFDLVPTSQTGTSSQQPKILNQYIVFTSADRKKLYIGVYSDEMKGFAVTEATSTVKHLFLSGIKDYFISDSPYRVIYVLTNDNECRVCIPTFGADGTIAFAWSTWDFGVSHPEYVCFDRRAESEPKTYFIMKDESTGKGWIYTLDYREPYLYGLKDTELLLDYADTLTAKNTRGSVQLTSPFLGYYDTADVMITYGDGEQVVLRNCRITSDGEAASVFINYQRADIPSDEDITIKVGRSYETRISLFQQLLPNNTGLSLVSRHSIDRLYLQIYRSQGGSVWANGAKIADILQLQYGRDLYNNNSTNPLTNAPYTFSGVYSIDNPVQNVIEDNLSIISDDPYPFNLMAVSIKYAITEVY